MEKEGVEMKRELLLAGVSLISMTLSACMAEGGCCGMCGASENQNNANIYGGALNCGSGPYVNPVLGASGPCVYFSSSPLIPVPSIPVAAPFVNTAESNPFPIPPPPRNMNAPQDLTPMPPATIYQNPEPVD